MKNRHEISLHDLAGKRGNVVLSVDRYGGIPLLGLTRLFRRRRTMPSPVQSIGLVKLTPIGDTVLLAGVVTDIAAAFPGAEIVFFAGPENAAIVRLFRGPSEVVVVPGTRPAAVVQELRRRHFDVVVDFGPWSRLEAGYAAWSGAFSVGFRTPNQARHFCHDAVVEHSDKVHELHNYRNLVYVLGVDSHTQPRLEVPGAVAPQRLPTQPYVVLHPWPSGVHSEYKQWPIERWVELASRLSAAGFTVALSGGENDASLSRGLAMRCASDVVDMAGHFSLTELLDVLYASSCVISVNTGTMHLAAASGAPTVALNGPTSELRWGPISERSVSVNSSFEGCGFLNLGNEYRGHRRDCMLGIDVERVFEAALKVMSLAPIATDRGTMAHE